MKKNKILLKTNLIFVILFLVIYPTSNIFAKCAWIGISVFPSGNLIKKNSIFIIEGHVKSQEIILQLNKKHDICLRDGDKEVRLIVTETLVGQYGLTQAILKPAEILEIGHQYTLEIDDLPEKEYRFFHAQGKAYTYNVSDEEDTKQPTIISRPKEIRKVYEEAGCGPINYIEFENTSIDEKSDIIVKTTVKNLKNQSETTYYIKPNGKTIRVGHDMCSGAFLLEKNGEYEVEFSYMDDCGNTAIWQGDRIKFSSPYQG